ncbi:MAG: oligosaccharide flippase family protein [Sphingobium sp.]|nr:MAG: oligosaccharide flippase family protein [Sphingobium sp.]
MPSFIEWSASILINLRKIVANKYLSNATSAVVNVLISTIIIFCAARFLSLEELGTYFQVLLITQIVSVLVDCGLRSSIIQEAPHVYPPESGQLQTYYLGQGVAQALVAIMGIVLLIGFFSQSMATPTRNAFLLSIPCIALNILFQNGTIIKIADGKAADSAKILMNAEIQRLILSILALFSNYKLELICLSWPISRITGIWNYLFFI